MTKNGVAGCKMEAVKVVKRDKQSEAEYVDSQYEYLIENKDKGITFEELRRRRSAER
jgi:hypothetical protein